MMIITDKLLFKYIYNLENLYHAWNRAKNIYDNENDFVFNRQELSEYEANLQDNLQSLSKRLKGNHFQMRPMLPMPLPKANGEDKVSRQHFHISLEDQIVWLAVINIIGPLLDDKMPFWSFGNRLYMPIWKEDDGNNDKKITRFGTYRSSSRKIYRNWTSSWPLFRKAVAITAKKMLHCKDSALNEDEAEDVDIYDSAPESFKIKTWESDYWNKKQPEDEDIFYATIDLSKFYPCIDAKNSILSGTVLRYIGINLDNPGNSELYTLLEKLLAFTIDNQYSADIDPSTEVDGDREGDAFFGIPTGLFVAGFLANIAMLEIDHEVQARISISRRIAHFRFVDDHVFLAYSIEELLEWIYDYEQVVARYLSRVKVNEEKIEPEAFKEYYEFRKKTTANEISLIKVKTQCRLDPLVASPFSTLTLRKLSGLNKDPFELMDENEKADLLRDIEHLLVTEFPDAEIRKDTRVSWAAMLLTRLVPEIDFNTSELLQKNNLIERKHIQLEETLDLKNELLNAELLMLEKEFAKLEEAVVSKHNQLNKKVFSLLLKALKDNIAKPKIWKRCINFCRTTGYDGIPLLLKQLDEDSRLSDNGKSYILAAIISEISSGLLTCIAINKSNRYSSREKQNAEKFANGIYAIQEVLFSRSTKYALFYSETVFEQFRMALYFYSLETKDSFELSVKNTYVYACYIWFALERTSNVFQIAPPKSFEHILESAMTDNVDAALIKKLRQMYEPNIDSLQKTGDDIASWVEKKRDILPNWVRRAVNELDLLASEWTCLEVVLKIIEAITEKRPTNTIFSFDNQSHQGFEFVNCSPYNFKMVIMSDKRPKEPWGWSEYKDYFRNEIKLEYQKSAADKRYDYVFYNSYGNVPLSKRQVCSLTTLLITLLSDDLAFPPLFNRRDPIDRNYTHILLKTKELNVSSYTRAILLGALSYREFEKGSFSVFDSVISKRDDDITLDPIKIEDLDDMKEHIHAAQKRLEHYQLSLENQAPRQLIPISLVNLSRTYNPYVGGNE